MYFRLTRDASGADSKGLTIVILGNIILALADALVPVVWADPISVNRAKEFESFLMIG